MDDGMHDGMHEASPPPLTTDATGWQEATAVVTVVDTRRLLMLPYAAPVGRSRGARYLVGIDDAPARPCVVLSVNGYAAIIPPAGADLPERHARVRLRALGARHSRRVPHELRVALAERGLDLGLVPDHEREQLILMINESATQGVRRARVEAAVQAVQAWSDRVGTS
jgi:hypothetical protein